MFSNEPEKKHLCVEIKFWCVRLLTNVHSPYTLDSNTNFMWFFLFKVVEDGYEFFAKRQLVTLFSAPNYCGEFDNAGGMMSVDETLMCSFQVSFFLVFGVM